MSNFKRRRERRRTQALLSNAETTMARAAARLFNGEPLSAMRLARVTEQLLALHSRVKQRRAHDVMRRLEQTEREFDARRTDLDVREAVLDAREQGLREEAERIEAMQRQVEALYAKIYAAPAADAQDGCR